MPTPDVTAGEIMDSAAALLNDVNKQVYTYAAQIPYVKIALKELRELMELNNIPVTNETSAVITVPASTTVVGFNTTPALPDDLVDIRNLWERPTGIDPFIPMTKREFLPQYMTGVEINQFLIYVWKDNAISLLSANQDNDLKIDYIKQLFGTFTDENSTIGVINSDSFLHYRTAGLCARFIGENSTRADTLDSQAYAAFDRVNGIESKAKQNQQVRRRPFRAGFKSRGVW